MEFLEFSEIKILLSSSVLIKKHAFERVLFIPCVHYIVLFSSLADLTIANSSHPNSHCLALYLSCSNKGANCLVLYYAQILPL